MRLFTILLLLFTAGLGWSLWQGIDVATGWLTVAEEPVPDGPIPDEVELTAAEQGPDPSMTAWEREETAVATPEPPSEATGTASTPEPAQVLAADAPAQAAATPAAVFEETTTGSPEAAAETASSTAEASASEAPPEPSADAIAKRSAAAIAAPDTRRVTGDQVNLRRGPDVGTDSLGLLSLDAIVEVLEVADDWLRVRTEDGTEGWVAARFLAPSQR